ncbi:hypothetical protein OQA88_13071 [Cercophora sp. LCS_1]
MAKGDVSRLEEVKKAISASPAPVRGILNLSMVLRDASLLAMNLPERKEATGPKAKGTWNLHEAAQGLELDFFVLFSSICGMIGMPGQANYAAANTFTDAFVQYRHQQHLTASVIDVGAVEGIGWTSENTKVLERSKWLEGAILSQRELFQATTIATFAPHPASPEVTAGGDGFTEPAQIITGFRSSPALSDTFRSGVSFLDRRLIAYSNQDARDGAGGDANAVGSTDLGTNLRRFVSTLPANLDKLHDPATSTFIATEVAVWAFNLLLKPVEDGADVDLARSFVDIGFDSLAAVELRSWWKAVWGLDISVLKIMSFANLAAISDFAVQGLKIKFEGT